MSGAGPGAAVPGRPADPGPRPPWYRRRAVLVGGAVVLVVAITVVSDLPVHTSRAEDVASERTVMGEVNTDVAPCALAVREALALHHQQAIGQLSATDRGGAPAFLRDDQLACSFTSESIFDLSNVEVPGSPAGRDVGQVVGTVTLWATSDALGAIEDVQTLLTDPSDATAARNLVARERQMDADRARADREADAADTILKARLPAPALVDVSLPPPAAAAPAAAGEGATG